MNKKFLHVQPSELKFPFRLNRLSTCWLQLTNIRTDHSIAFKDALVSLQAQKANPLGIPKDKFLVQSIIAPVGLTSEKITSQLFKKETVELEEQKLRVVFVTKDPPSPIPEGSEEECCTRDSELEKQERKNNISTLFDSVSKSTGSPEDWDTVLKLIDEKFRLVQENQELRYDVEIVRRQIKTVKSRNVVILVTLSVLLLGFVIGYFIK